MLPGMERAAAGTQHGAVLPVRTDPRGISGPTRRQAQGPAWRRTSRGFHVPVHVELTPEQRILEAGHLVPAYGAVTGWAGLRWLGGAWFSGLESTGLTPRPVVLACARQRIRAQQGFELCQERFDPRETLLVDGLAVTTAVRSLCFEVRYATHPWAAVAAIDMAAYHDLVSLAEIAAYVDLHPSWTGIEQARSVTRLGDENAWSPPEVTMRLTWWLEAGLPRPLTNRPVFDLSGRHVATPDLLDPVAGVFGEYDGALHLAATRRTIDLRREADLRALGLEGVTMVAADLRDRSHFVMRLRQAYDRAADVPSQRRRFSLELPPGWPATQTVAQRRALSPELAARWLRHRRPGRAS